MSHFPNLKTGDCVYCGEALPQATDGGCYTDVTPCPGGRVSVTCSVHGEGAMSVLGHCRACDFASMDEDSNVQSDYCDKTENIATNCDSIDTRSNSDYAKGYEDALNEAARLIWAERWEPPYTIENRVVKQIHELRDSFRDSKRDRWCPHSGANVADGCPLCYEETLT